MPVFLNEGSGGDRGLICAYQVQAAGAPRELSADEIVRVLQRNAITGRVRRLCARLRRQFSPERSDMSLLLHRLTGKWPEPDYEAMHSSTEALGFALEDIVELYERAKLLQEELAARLAENTGRNLYVLSILTAVLLPMTLVTGIFGMNVAGLPGLHSAHAFAWVMVLIVASGALTLAILCFGDGCSSHSAQRLPVMRIACRGPTHEYRSVDAMACICGRRPMASQDEQRRHWPELPYTEWQDTCIMLHLWTQIVGKIRLSLTPWVNDSLEHARWT